MNGNLSEYELLVRGFTDIQVRFLSARLGVNSDAEAARLIGISEDTPTRWSNKADVRRAVELSRLDGLVLAYERARRMVSKALDVYEDEMDNRRGHPGRMAAANQIVKLNGMEPPAKSEGTIEHTGRVSIDLNVKRPYGSTIPDVGVASTTPEPGSGSS